MMSIEKSKSLRGPKVASNKLFYSLRRPKYDKKRSSLNNDNGLSQNISNSSGANAVHSDNPSSGDLYLTPQSTRHLKWTRDNNNSNNNAACSSTPSINNSMTDPMKSSDYSRNSSQQYSYPTDGFNSLPNRGLNHRNYQSLFDNETKVPNIRYQIETAPAVTYKKIIYRENSEPNSKKPSKQSLSIKCSKSNQSTNHTSARDDNNTFSMEIINCDGNLSNTSLDSACEPKVAAALDTIATTLGFAAPFSSANNQTIKPESFRTTQSSPMSHSSSVVKGSSNPQSIRQFNTESREALQFIRNARSFSEKHKHTKIPPNNSVNDVQPENIHHRRVKSQVDRSSSSPVEWRKQKIFGVLSPFSTKKSQNADQYRKVQSYNIGNCANSSTNYSASSSPNKSRRTDSKRSSGSISSPVKWFRSATRSLRSNRNKQTSSSLSLQNQNNKPSDTSVFTDEKEMTDPSSNVPELDSREIEGQLEVEEKIQAVKVSQQKETPQPKKNTDLGIPPKYPSNLPDKSQKILQSLQTDRIDDLYSKFRQVSKKKSKFRTGEINPRVHSIENRDAPETSSFSSPTPCSPNYIHISLSAFGYSPNNLQYPKSTRSAPRTPSPKKKEISNSEFNQASNSRRSNSTSSAIK